MQLPLDLNVDLASLSKAMIKGIRIGVIGDFNPEFRTHPAIAIALRHSAGKLGMGVEVEWVSTLSVTPTGADNALESFDGLIAAPGSPYRSFDGMLRGIQFARIRNWPFTAT
jgi:CTP synthase (UTP-ammonia lyase)